VTYSASAGLEPDVKLVDSRRRRADGVAIMPHASAGPSGESGFQAAAGIAMFARAHAANFVGCRPATLLASAMAARESAPR
jgi:hypothetical protein